MGAVYRADDLQTGEALALKVVLPGPGDGTLLPRFLREARLAAKIRHPHVVRILDFGRWTPPGELEQYYLAMELVEGVPLSALFDLPEVDAGAWCALACQVLGALAHVHARGILHRDVKPDNVLIRRGPKGLLSVALTDFGIAAAYGAAAEGQTRLTQEGALVGTPEYIAPEQALGSALPAPGIDLYPVGVILYRALAGRLPFSGPLTRLVVDKVTKDPPPLEVGPVDEVVMRLIARAPERRHAVAADALADLLAFSQPARLDEGVWDGLVAQRARELQSAPRSRPAAKGSNSPGEALWGRAALLAELKQHAAEVERGQGRVLLLQGPVGIGKSALANQLAVESAEAGRATVLRGAFAAGGSGGLRAAIDQLLGTVGRSASAVEQAARELLRRHGDDDPQELADLVAWLRPSLGAEEADEGALGAQDKGFALVVRMLRRLARERPAMLLLDDLHAGGPGAVGFVDHVLFELGFEPCAVLVLATMRTPHSPEIEAVLRRSGRHEGLSRFSIAVGPIEEEVLAQGLADARGLTPRSASFVAQRAGGNPLFAMHLANAGEVDHAPRDTDSQALGMAGRAKDSGSRPTARTPLPAALVSILELSFEERLAKAPEPAAVRELATWVALLGPPAPVGLLEAVAGDGSELDDRLDWLIDAGICVERGEDRIAFSTGVLRDALLDRLGRRRSRRLQLQAAKAREAWGRGRAEEAGPIGDHYAAAGRRAEAVPWWIQACDWEAASGDAFRAAAYGSDALAEIERSDPRYGPLALKVGELLREIVDHDRAEAILTPVLEDPDADLALQAGELLALLVQDRGASGAWRAVVDRVASRWEEAGPVGRRAGDRARAFFFNQMGQPRDGRKAAERALEGAPAGREAFDACQRLMWACVLDGDRQGAMRATERAQAEAEGRPALRGESLRVAAACYTMTGLGDQAVEAAEQALAYFRRTGRVNYVARGLVDLGFALASAERYPEARKVFADAMRAARELDLTMEAGRGLLIERFTLVAEALPDPESEMFATAEASFAAMQQMIAQAGMWSWAATVHLGQAWLSLHAGDLERAREHLEAAFDSPTPPYAPPVPQFAANLALRVLEEPSLAHVALPTVKLAWGSARLRGRDALAGRLKEAMRDL